MYFIKFNIDNGMILGLHDEETDFVLNIEENWYTLNEKTYEFILENNGNYIIDINNCQHKIEEYKLHLQQYLDKKINKLSYITIDTDDLCIPDTPIINIIKSKMLKNNQSCQNMIQAGIMYEINNDLKQFTFNLEDQMNYISLKAFIDNNNITDNIPIKAHNEDEWLFVSKDIFNDLYNKLMQNKYYQLLYLRQFNKQIETIKDINTLERMQYEANLTEPFLSNLNKQISKISFKGDN